MALCYKDRAYCSVSRLTCFNDKCYRFLSVAESINSIKVGLPVAYSDFSIGCEDIIKGENK